MVDNELSEIGRRLRQIRHARKKSLTVVAGLAGMSAGHLSRVERGERALDRRSDIVALANALEIAPYELMALPVPAPANGGMDTTIEAIRSALASVSLGMTEGSVQPVQELQSRLSAVFDMMYRAEDDLNIGAALPDLIRDVHATIAAGRDIAALLELAVLLHTRAVVGWLSVAGAPLDLRFQAIMLARNAAGELDAAAPLGLVTAGSARVLRANGSFDLARAGLNATTVPTDRSENMQLAGYLALLHSVIAASVDGRPDDHALDVAAELAERTGEGSAYGLWFGPFTVSLYRMDSLVEAGDHQQVAHLAATVNPSSHSPRSQSYYWSHYGKALTRIRGRRDDAVRALRQAERLAPRLVQRDPVARETINELLAHSDSRNVVGTELRGMAYRCGLVRDQ